MSLLEQLQLVDATYPWTTGMYWTIFGLLVGSFLNVCIYRIPAGRSVIWPGSACACGTPIAWYDNVPVVSWLVLRGRARCCGRKISIRYPLIEALTGVLYFLLWRTQSFADAAAYSVFFAALIAAAMIDLDHLVIPDRFTMGLAAIGFVILGFRPELKLSGAELVTTDHPTMVALLRGVVDGAIGTACGAWIAFIAERALGKEAFGMGDVKLLGAFGVFIGWRGVLFTIGTGAVLALVPILFGAVVRKWKGRDGGTFGVEHPFGPALCSAAVVYVLACDPLVRRYFDQFTLLFN